VPVTVTGGARHGGWGGLGVGSNGPDPVFEAAQAQAAAQRAAADQRFLSQSVGTIDNASADTRAAVHAAELIHAAKSKLDLGDPDGAVRDATSALALAPDSPAALTLRSSAFNLLGRNEEARRDALDALRFKPDEASPAEDLAWALLRLRDYDGAGEAAARALKANPRSALALATRAYAEQMQGRRAAMLADIEAAAALDSRFAALAALARAGKAIYNPGSTDASYLLGAAASAALGAERGAAWPWALGLLTLAGLGACGVYLFSRRRRKTGALHLTPRRPSRPGEEDLVGGKYRLEGIIGRGGMGEVRRAKDTVLGRTVAVKTLVADLAGAGDDWSQKLRAEATTVAGIHHPNIVDIYELIEERGVLYLIFEFVEGQTVHSVLATRGRLAAKDCARVLAPVCAALELAHSRGLVHRDLKPANIMITVAGHVKLMDFGIARPVGQRVKNEDGGRGAQDPLFDRTQTIMGTPVYMAPEAEQGLVGPAGDVFSLGACLYEMLTGSRPFPSGATALDKLDMKVAPPSVLAPGVPPGVDRLVAEALSPDPAARPAPAEFARRLRAEAKRGKDGETPRTPRASRTPRTPRTPRSPAAA